MFFSPVHLAPGAFSPFFMAVKNMIRAYKLLSPGIVGLAAKYIKAVFPELAV